MASDKVQTSKKDEIIRLKREGRTFKEIAKLLDLSMSTIKGHYYMATGQPSYRVPESPYPIFDSPIEAEGDALIIPDAEIPFHHAEFINKVLDLTIAWGIKQVIYAGDLVHFDSLSGWEPQWSNKPNGGLSEDDERTLMNAIQNLPEKYQDEVMDALGEIGSREEGPGFSQEMHHTRKTIAAMEDIFTNKVWVLGNHEGRLLRTINSPVMPSELLNLLNLNNDTWKISPYYYCILKSGGQTYRIEHPKSASKGTAERLAAKFQCNVLMGHSHLRRDDYDVSGNYHACHIGHMVDEDRLAYAAQRSTNRDKHMLGAAIIRDGYYWGLDRFTDFKRLEACK
jgi:hypothetical protein